MALKGIHFVHNQMVQPGTKGVMYPSIPLFEGQHMQYQILKEPMAFLDIHLDNGETITAEAGAMVYMQGDIEVQDKDSRRGRVP